MDKEERNRLRKDIDKRLERLNKDSGKTLRRLQGQPMDKEDIPKALEKARTWIAIIAETQAVREKYGQKPASGFDMNMGSDSVEARMAIDDLEKAVYGGYLGALRKRLENIERALLEAQGGTQQ